MPSSCSTEEHFCQVFANFDVDQLRLSIDRDQVHHRALDDDMIDVLEELPANIVDEDSRQDAKTNADR